jgi:hypothetical protein
MNAHALTCNRRKIVYVPSCSGSRRTLMQRLSPYSHAAALAALSLRHDPTLRFFFYFAALPLFGARCRAVGVGSQLSGTFCSRLPIA